MRNGGSRLKFLYKVVAGGVPLAFASYYLWGAGTLLFADNTTEADLAVAMMLLSAAAVMILAANMFTRGPVGQIPPRSEVEKDGDADA